MDITKGDWEVDGGLIMSENGAVIGCTYAGGAISPEEDEANIRLMAEAGTVANSTGLMPKELLTQRDELLAACIKAHRQLTYMLRNVEDDKQIPYEVLVPLKQAISNAKGSK